MRKEYKEKPFTQRAAFQQNEYLPRELLYGQSSPNSRMAGKKQNMYQLYRNPEKSKHLGGSGYYNVESGGSKVVMCCLG